MPLLAALRDRLPSAAEARDRAVTLYHGVRSSQAVADARATARAARRRWDRSRLRLDPELARALLQVIEEETVPGLAPVKTTVFEKERCRYCLGIHSRKCPAVKELEYATDSGRIQRVTFWPKWDDGAVLWREDIETAAAWKDDPDAS